MSRSDRNRQWRALQEGQLCECVCISSQGYSGNKNYSNMASYDPTAFSLRICTLAIGITLILQVSFVLADVVLNPLTKLPARSPLSTARLTALRSVGWSCLPCFQPLGRGDSHLRCPTMTPFTTHRRPPKAKSLTSILHLIRTIISGQNGSSSVFHNSR
jgi:hypothetical protein